MSEHHNSSSSYPNAFSVFNVLNTVQESADLPRAMAHKFRSDEAVIGAPLNPDELLVLRALAIDGFARLPTLQLEIDQYREDYMLERDWLQQLKSMTARTKTLELQMRNVEQEQSKTGLFSGKSKQELLLKASRIQAQLSHCRQEASILGSKLEGLEYKLKAIAEAIQADEGLKYAKWIHQNMIAVQLTPKGLFLLEYLEEISSELMHDRPLSQILLYGHQWSAQVSNS
jgi:hypothetical protein